MSQTRRARVKREIQRDRARQHHAKWVLRQRVIRNLLASAQARMASKEPRDA